MLGLRLIALVLAVPCLALGCTALIINDYLQDPAPCDEPSECAAGFVCTDGLCTSSSAQGAPPPAGFAVDESGGTVPGPDGVTLVIPAGALDGAVHLSIARASSTIIPTGVDDVSGFYTVTPALALAEPATFSIPVGGACPGCALFGDPGDDASPWIALEAPAVSPGGAVSGLMDALGDLVVAGREAP